MRRLTLGLLAVVFGLFLLAVGIGTLLPHTHVAEATADVDADPATVFALIADPRTAPAWRDGVDSVTLTGDPAQPGSQYIEHSGSDHLRFEVVEHSPPARRTTRLADPEQPYGGTWTTTLVPTPTGTRVRIVEEGFVDGALYRFSSVALIGHTRSMRAYLDALQRHLQ
jgi:uncharacterized protein YndB with AHSA1/START domain